MSTREKTTKSHMYIHQQLAHKDNEDFASMFRFYKVDKHPTAFTRQLAEAIYMKSSSCIVLNLKDEYTRCMIPNVTLGDRGWNVDGPQ